MIFSELDIQKELSYISFERMSDSAHFLVHIFKKLIQHGDKVKKFFVTFLKSIIKKKF